MKLYTGIGVLFAAIGGVMVVTAATEWHASQDISWQLVFYAILNLLAAYGFFTRSRWLLPGFTVAIVGLLAVSLLFAANYGSEIFSLPTVLKIAIAALIVWFLYSTRRHLRVHPYELHTGAMFIILLVGTMSYTALTALL